MAEWHTPDTAHPWLEGASIEDEQLEVLLDVARSEVLAFAPEIEDEDEPPLNYVLAQVMHARNLINAASVSPEGALGSEDFVLRPFPLDWQIKQRLRPKRPALRVW